MSLQEIVEAILAAGEAQVQEISRQAQRQAGEILASAQAEAQQIEEKVRNTTAAPAGKERARILHQAHLQALRTTGEARESLVTLALGGARDTLSTLREDPAYPIVLRKLVQEALASLKFGLEENVQARLEADPRDRALMENILIGIGAQIPVLYGLNCWGGVVAKTEDGRVVAINTLEARLERALPNLRRYLAALFEETGEGTVHDRPA